MNKDIFDYLFDARESIDKLECFNQDAQSINIIRIDSAIKDLTKALALLKEVSRRGGLK